MWVVTAVGDSGELAAAYIPALWTFLGIVVATLGTIAVQSMKSRSERTSTPPAPTHNGDGASLLQVARDVAHDIGQLDQRANDNDERDDVQDHRLDAIERHLDTRNPDWRR